MELLILVLKILITEQKVNFLDNICHISPICKAFANFTLTACGLGALCAVVALAQGGGAAALAGLACCLLGGWAALKVHYLE